MTIADQESSVFRLSPKKKVRRREIEYNIDSVGVNVSSSSLVQINSSNVCNSRTVKQRLRLSHGLLRWTQNLLDISQGLHGAGADL